MQAVEHASLQERLEARLQREPENPALAFYDGAPPLWVPYEEVHRRALCTAAALGEQGLAPGDVALIVLPSAELASITTLAVLLHGAVPLLVAPPAVAGTLLDLPRMLGRTALRTRARLAVCSGTLALMRAEIESGAGTTKFLFDFAEPAPGPAGRSTPVQRSATDVAAMQLTSGTTGSPRICVWEQRAVLAALDGMAGAMGLAADDVCFNWTPLYHDMGLVNNFLLCLTAGVPLALMGPEAFARQPGLWPRGLCDTGATLGWSPNFGFALAAQRVRDDELAGVRLDRVRALWNAAERVHPRSVEEFQERYRPYGLGRGVVKTNFGCAENVGGATFSDLAGAPVVERIDAQALHAERIARPPDAGAAARALTVVGVGRPHAGLAVLVLGEDGTPLTDGRVGRIALRTPSRMRAYLDDEPETRGAFLGDLLITGDLGYLRGGELFWTGREAERITIRGRKLDPSELEPVLLDVDGLREGCFAAFGVEDEAAGTERLVVVCEVREPLRREPGVIAAEIQRQTFLRLGASIGEILLVRPRTLSKTSSGKRRHRHFRRLYLENALASCRVDSLP